MVKKSSHYPVRDFKAPRCETVSRLPALRQSCDRPRTHVGKRWTFNVAPATLFFFLVSFFLFFIHWAISTEEISRPGRPAVSRVAV